MESQWSGDAENAYFSADKFDKYRVATLPEHEHLLKVPKGTYYVIGIDVGRYRCATEAVIFKVVPQPGSAAIKTVVNLFSYKAEDFEMQAINIKRLYYKYQPRALVIDANGLGCGFVDFMTKTQIDPETGEKLPPFGVASGSFAEAATPYKHVKGPDVVEDAMYLIKANVALNSEAYTYIQTQMFNGKLRFLIDEIQAKNKLLTTKAGQEMDAVARNEFLQPFVLTSVLRTQLLNLVEEREGINVILKQCSHSIPKDKVSALAYGMYYIKQEDSNTKRRKRNIKDLMFFS